MATFICLVNFTEQGLRSVDDTVERADAFKRAAAAAGVMVKDLYWTFGAHNIVAVMEGDNEAVVATVLQSWSYGNVHGQILQAYDSEAMTRILGKT